MTKRRNFTNGNFTRITCRSIEKQVDHYYRRVELNCATLMTPPVLVAQELRLVSTFRQLIRSLERVGDNTKDLVEIAIKLLSYPLNSS